MALSNPQRTIVNDTHRFRVAICGRRFGKTHLSMRELARFAREPGKKCWYIAPTWRMAKQTVWEQLKARLIELRWVQKINESDLTIYLINNSTISLRSADNADSLRGVGLDFVVLDEFADMDPVVWQAVLRPTLSDRNGSALFIGTPKGTANWAKDIYDMAKTNPQWKSFSYTTLDGGRVSAEEIDAARADLDARQFKQEYEASFENFSSRIFYAFSEENIKTYNGTGHRELHVGQDFNVSPMTATVGVRDGEDFYIIDEIVINNSNTDEMVAEINSRYSGSKITVYPDPAARQRKTSAGGRTDLTILQNAGFTVHCPNAHRPVKDDINAVNARLCNTKGVRRLFVDPKCKYTIQGFERWTYKEGTSVPDKDTGYDHIMDAMRYCIGYLWPLRKDIEPQVPMRWGHKLG